MMATQSKTQKLTKEHFRFLQEKLGFKYDPTFNTYSNEKICIIISSSRLEPVVEIWVKSEPRFTTMNFKWYINYLEEKELLQSKKLGNTLEANFKYFSQLLNKHIKTIIREDRKVLIKVIKLFLMTAKRHLRFSTRQLIKADEEYKKLYQYVKNNDPNWKPNSDIS